MALDDRLEVLATGVSVSDAIESYLAGLDGDVDAAARAESEAIVEVMYLVAAVDGTVSDDELEQLRSTARELATAGVIARIDPDALVPKLRARCDADGWQPRLQAAAKALRADETRKLAFRLGAGVAFVDDSVAAAEAAALDSLAKALSLTPDDAQLILTDVQKTLFG